MDQSDEPAAFVANTSLLEQPGQKATTGTTTRGLVTNGPATDGMPLRQCESESAADSSPVALPRYEAKQARPARPAISSSPKMEAQISAHGYRYYAGFSADFVSEALLHLGVTDADTVLDPWNGSGTTTLVASRAGIASIGVDLNPAMKVVALGRLLQAERQHITYTARQASQGAPKSPRSTNTEPLRNWFTSGSAARIRALANRITSHPDGPIDPDSLTPLEAHLLTSLFVTVRAFLKPALTSNPVWVRRSLPEGGRISVSWRALTDQFRSVTEHLAFDPAELKTEPALYVADAVALSSAQGTSTVVLGSPPYCTRIDYVAATRPELATLGRTVAEQERLRRSMLGTTTVGADPRVVAGRSEVADKLLATIASHASRASSTYYRKWMTQYLDGYYRSLASLNALVPRPRTVALVVQDSYYKEQHIDLATITKEFGASLGWSHIETVEFAVPRTMASINQRTRAYRGTFKATESLLVFAPRQPLGDHGSARGTR